MKHILSLFNKFFYLAAMVGIVPGSLYIPQLITGQNSPSQTFPYQFYLPFVNSPGSSMQPAFYSCENNKSMKHESYLVLNNQWNKNVYTLSLIHISEPTRLG